MPRVPAVETRIALMTQSLENIENKVDEIKKTLENHYVTQDQLKLRDEKIARLEKVVYGAVSAIALEILALVVIWITNQK